MELQIFQNSGFQIRGGLINNEPYFVAKDVCAVLELANVGEAINGLDEDELTSLKLMSGGQMREMKVVTEDEKGIYKIDTLGGSLA